MENIFKTDRCQDEQEGTEWVLGWGHSISALLEFEKEGGETPRQAL